MKLVRAIALLFCFLFIFASTVFSFTISNTIITRTFNKNEASINELITVSVNFTNNETSSLRGFYYAEQVPEGLVVNTVGVSINGNPVSNYLFKSVSVGDVYPGNVVYRWILETPAEFLENNPISATSQVEIIYTLSSPQAATFNLDEFKLDWVLSRGFVSCFWAQ
jgi:hypothetical protein